MHEDFVGILSSGSVGNSMVVVNSGKGLMIDAGLSCRELERRLSLFGIEPTQIEGLLLTHEHEDHIRGARKFSTKYGIPVYATRGTLALSGLDDADTRTIAPNRRVKVGDFLLKPFRVRHLAAEPVAFSISIGGRRVGIATDLGSIAPNVVEELDDSDLLFIEANYDVDMLLNGSYPGFLKRAIKGDHGHLSNLDAGTLSAMTTTSRTREVVLVHLSKENNTPKVARETVEKRLQERKSRTAVAVSEHGVTSGPYPLR